MRILALGRPTSRLVMSGRTGRSLRALAMVGCTALPKVSLLLRDGWSGCCSDESRMVSAMVACMVPPKVFFDCVCRVCWLARSLLPCVWVLLMSGVWTVSGRSLASWLVVEHWLLRWGWWLSGWGWRLSGRRFGVFLSGGRVSSAAPCADV